MIPYSLVPNRREFGKIRALAKSLKPNYRGLEIAMELENDQKCYDQNGNDFSPQIYIKAT